MTVMVMTMMTTYLQVLHQYDTLLLWLGHENTAAAEEAVLKQATVNLLILHIKEGLVTCTRNRPISCTTIDDNISHTNGPQLSQYDHHIVKESKVGVSYSENFIYPHNMQPDSYRKRDGREASSQARPLAGMASQASPSLGKRCCTRKTP